MLDQLKQIWNSTMSGIPFPKIWGVLIVAGIVLLGLTFLPVVILVVLIAIIAFAAWFVITKKYM